MNERTEFDAWWDGVFSPLLSAVDAEVETFYGQMDAYLFVSTLVKGAMKLPYGAEAVAMVLEPYHQSEWEYRRMLQKQAADRREAAEKATQVRRTAPRGFSLGA